jgi:hypothetical protein
MQQTQINGNRYSFTNVSVNLGGQEIAKGVFSSINYKATQEPGIVQGNQVTIVGRTEGYGTGTGSFEMLVSELDDFFNTLTGGGVFPIMSVDFDIIVAYSVNDIDVRVDSLLGCRIDDIDSPNQQGTDATKKTNSLTIARVFLNGIAAFADPAI